MSVHTASQVAIILSRSERLGRKVSSSNWKEVLLVVAFSAASFSKFCSWINLTKVETSVRPVSPGQLSRMTMQEETFCNPRSCDRSVSPQQLSAAAARGLDTVWAPVWPPCSTEHTVMARVLQFSHWFTYINTCNILLAERKWVDKHYHNWRKYLRHEYKWTLQQASKFRPFIHPCFCSEKICESW